MTALRVLVLHNPTAGDEEHSRDSLHRVLDDAGHDVVVRSLKEPGWEGAMDRGADLVVAAGGDGTVRKVFRELAGKNVQVTILPLGSANNIARSLGFEVDDPGRLVKGWAAARPQRYDIPTLSHRKDKTPFVESAGAGLFADIIARAEEDESGDDDKVATGLRMLLESIEAGPLFPITFELDGERWSDEVAGVELMNVSYAGPQIPLAPAADPGDGALDVVHISADDARHLRDYAEARLAGDRSEPPKLQVRRATQAAVEVPAGCRVHVDDEVRPPDRRGEVVRAGLAAQVRILIPPGPGGA